MCVEKQQTPEGVHWMAATEALSQQSSRQFLVHGPCFYKHVTA